MTRSLPFFSKGLEPSRDLNYRTYEERSKFILTFTENDRWRLLFETCYYGALRIGELIGLKRKDFKAVNKTIYVDNQVDRSGNITSLKTESSRSLVDLPTFLVDELENYRIKSKALDEEFMFFFKKTSRTTIRRKMDEHIKLAGVKKITVHGLRHSCASMMINSGVNVLYISQHLRHKSTQQTLDTYSHLFPSNSYGIMDNVFEKITPVLTPKTNPQK
jgi:integrase